MKNIGFYKPQTSGTTTVKAVRCTKLPLCTEFKKCLDHIRSIVSNFFLLHFCKRLFFDFNDYIPKNA